MDLTLKDIQVTIILSDATDKVIVKTTLPSPIPLMTKQTLSLTFDVEYDKGAEYVRTIFGVEPRIIDTRH